MRSNSLIVGSLFVTAALLVGCSSGALFAALSVTAVQALLLLLVPRRILLTVSAATGSLMLAG